MRTRYTTWKGGLYAALMAYGLGAGLLSAQNAEEGLIRVNQRYFIESKGQWPELVLFLARLDGLDFWITREGMTLNFFQRREISLAGGRSEPLCRGEFRERGYEVVGHSVAVRLIGANPFSRAEGRQKQPGYHNYLIGSDPSRHASFVGLYWEVVVREVYPGVDMRYYFEGGRVRFDWVVGPDADAGRIRFAVEGADRVEVDGAGRLRFWTRFGEAGLADLRVYQGRDGHEVSAHFVRAGEGYAIALGPYDRTQTLVIDPLVYSTHLGESAKGTGIAVDGSGHAYVTGKTYSLDFPTTRGAYQTTNKGEDDIFVTKLSVDGGSLVYSTYLGGSEGDEAAGIAVDGSGYAYVTGKTYSSDFPTTSGAYQTTHRGNGDAFVAKLNVDGGGLVYSTYLGGSKDDEAAGIAVDASGHAYVTGIIYSSDFPTTSGAYQTTHRGNGGAFVAKLSVDGGSLVYSTYLGGSEQDEAYGIAVDGSGHAYVTGRTYSSDFPTTSGAYQVKDSEILHEYFQSYAFMTKLSVDGRALMYSTYLKIECDIDDYHTCLNRGSDIVVDGSGYAYVVESKELYQAVPSIHGPGWHEMGSQAVVKKLCPGKILSISLSSETGTDRQTVCVNTPIRAINYLMPGASGANAAGLPSGVSLSFSDGIATIQGTPKEAGIFTYTITAKNGCGSATGTLTVRPNTAITLTSAPGTHTQTVCVNTPVTPITYHVTEAAGAEVKGLPAGVTSRFENGTLTISGTPTEVGTFNYTVTPVGGCGSTSATGTIKVRPNTTAITLTSSPRTANQKVRVNKKPIKPITYSVVDATGAEAKGLPPGVTGSYAGGVFTISGTPTQTGVYNYVVLPVGGCGEAKGEGVITVRP